MKIVIDSDIPFVDGVFEPFAQVVRLSGRDICRASVVDADALIVRTRTRCDAALLDGSAVRVIATATIGIDHIDTQYCRAHSIEVYWAAGCNSRAVAQWVFAAIDAMGADGVLGIVGLGNVGTQVELIAGERGMSVVRNDPPRMELGHSGFVGLNELLALADIVTVHVPLLPTTESMVDSAFIARMRPGAVLLNSSRGEVVSQQALLASTGLRFGLDVWVGEPNIDPDLLAISTIATAHIAGYSARGKARASEMVVCAVAGFLGIEQLVSWAPQGDLRLEQPEDFDIMAAHEALRASPGDFERLRVIR